jgi:hypothetical protein
MSEMNELENQLRSWVPRAPSAKLERNIFERGPVTAKAVGAATEATSTTHKSPTFRLSWLAPATVAFLLICVLFNQHNIQALSGSVNSAPIVAVALSNQSVAAWFPASFSRERNALPNETFEWTNGSISNVRSVSGVRGTTE